MTIVEPSDCLLIIDSSTKFLFEHLSNAKIVLSKSELATINLQQYKAIIIIAELEWEGEYLQNFYGFDIAVDIRRKYKLLTPIIIISTFFNSYFEYLSENKIKYKILFGRGTTFLHVFDVYEHIQQILNRIKPVSPAVLTDLNDMLLNIKGMITDRLTHDLRPDMQEIELAQTLNETSIYLTDQQTANLNWQSFQDRLSESLGNSSGFYKQKEELLLKIDQQLADPADRHKNLLIRQHKIIILEDDAQFALQIQSKLENYFEELIVTRQADEAIRILDEDKNNSITAIITDWRLYADSQKKYWQMQGYEVLDYAAKNHLIALFSLTSLSDKNVHSIRNILGLDINLFKKNYFLDSSANAQWELLADAIHQKCDEVLEIISSQPTGSGWEKYKSEYITKRSFGWKSFNYEIENESKRIFDFYNEAIINKEYKNVFSINEMGISIKNNLKNTLIIRRVYIGLYFTLAKTNAYLQEIRPVKLLGEGEVYDTELRHHSIDAYSLIRKDWWDDVSATTNSINVENEWNRFEQRIKNLRTALCLELAALPVKGLLPEEKSWLTKNTIDYGFLFNYWSVE